MERATVSRPDRPITAADVMSAGDVAELVGISTKTVHRWALAGKIPHRKRGNRTLFIRWEIEAWILSDPRGPDASGDTHS